MDTPRIYVACLAAYNAGTLHGAWIDAAQDADDIAAEVTAMLKASPEPGAEEWAIHDYEGFPSGAVSEWESFEKVVALAAFLKEHGEAAEAFLLWSDGVETDELEDSFSDAYAGEAKDGADFAYTWYDDVYGVDNLGPLAGHIDWESVWRDMSADYSGVYVRGTFYVFR